MNDEKCEFAIDINADGDYQIVDIDELMGLYTEHVDHSEYETFEDWKYDMIKSGLLRIA